MYYSFTFILLYIRKLEGEGFEEIEELSENEIVEKQIINNDLSITYATGPFQKRKP